jgi:hypothetical protein
MNLSDLLPLSGVPRSGGPEKREEKWSGQDNLEDYRKRGGHPLYGVDDIRYRYNARGNRCPEFDEEAEVRIISIGCSWVFGAGLPQEAIFHEHCARRLRLELGATVVNWNLGTSGASNDSIARVLHLAIPRLDPHLVLVLFTRLQRRECMTADNRHIRYNPSWKVTHPVVPDEWNHLEAFTSEYDDQLNFFRNYKSIECLLAGRLWLFSILNPSHVEHLGDHLDPLHKTAGHSVVDRARDHGHPGAQTHELIGKLFWQRFVETGGLESLRCLTSQRTREEL